MTERRRCLETTGAAHYPAVCLPLLANLRSAFEHGARWPGSRLTGLASMRQLLLRNGPVGRLAAAVIGPDARPVRALLLDKRPNRNWALGWHQDRVVCVRERIETPGFGCWTNKRGLPHVAPPTAVLERMVTVRVHLDTVESTNAPLLVAPGSHRYGRVPEESVQEVVRDCGTLMCLAEAGDVWLYRTLILHASARAASPSRRRVLQVDYAAHPLPNGLRWHDPTIGVMPDATAA